MSDSQRRSKTALALLGSLVLHGLLLFGILPSERAPERSSEIRVAFEPVRVSVQGSKKKSAPSRKNPINGVVPTGEGTDTPAAVENPEQEATLIGELKPVYPGLSRTLGEQGEVLLLVRISSEGIVEEVKLEKSSGFSRLDSSALLALKDAHFRVRSGAAQNVSARIVVVFRLNDR